MGVHLTGDAGRAVGNAGNAAGLRVGFFGTFYPSSERAGSFSTSLAWEMARLPGVAAVRVFGPTGATVPPGADPQRLQVRAAWAADDPFSLVVAFARMWRDRGQCDVYLFSIYVTAFGRRAASNVAGLLLPAAVRIAARRPVFIYMHNFLETQDAATLGFDVGRSTAFGVRLLERTLTALTRVIVPLRSMQTVVEREIGGTCDVQLLPFLEADYAATRPDAPEGGAAPAPPAPPVRVLLFGYWGPQKDLPGALAVLGELVREDCPVEVTIAGEANPGFPEYLQQLEAARRNLPADRFRFVGRVAEEEVFRLVRSHHLLLLPYRATGGISGVMNVGALADLTLVAYDVPQLREFAGELGVRVAFVPPGDPAALKQTLRSEVDRLVRPGRPVDRFGEHIAAARIGVEQLVARMRGAATPSA